MASKIITGKQKQAEQIKEAIRTHGDAIAEALDARIPSQAGAGAAARTLLRIAHDALDDALLQATRTDMAHAAELADDHQPRSARNEAATQLRGTLVDLRRTIAALHGDSQVKALGFPARIPRDPVQVERVAFEVLGALRKAPLPKPALLGVAPVSSEDWIPLLDEGLAALASARAEVVRETQEARATQTARDRASATLTDVMVTTAQIAVSLARLAGRPELVAGLRGTLASGTVKTLEEAEGEEEQGEGSTERPQQDGSRPFDLAPKGEPTIPRHGASVPPSAPMRGKTLGMRAMARRKR